MSEPKVMSPRNYGLEIGMRPDTPLTRWPINFVFNEGGMGDFVNYAAATVWVAKNCPWVHGRIFTPRYLNEILKDIHAPFHNWAIFASERARELLENKTALIGPNIVIKGVNTTKQLLNCMGAHPIDVAFAYYANMCPAPKDAYLPVLDYSISDLIPEVAALNKKYVVVPVGNTTDARKITGKHLNPIIQYIFSRGLTPVFLGKVDMLGDGIATTRFADDIDFHKGLDLRDRTTLKEAACILQHSRAVIGLDCGLLHLAALMKDSNIIFGYNITTVEHRVPRRNHGVTINLSVSEEELKCIGCQSKLKHIARHKFSSCIYGDTLCLDLLFKNNSSNWITALKALDI
ncbi:MAG: hypothetical protein H0X02_01910 [Nitrosomonas sp.]|nr:hypothetical protein [Nitrosomonas sp.]